jgi:DNA invertase Pin-like site-specific DNA recombinase
MSHPTTQKWGYHRVSTVYGQSLELGRKELIEAGIPEDKIWSEQISGKSAENRPELNAMLKALQPGTEICVCKLDRLARNTKDLLEIAEKIKKAGATLNILDLKIDTSSPVGELILTVLGACAQLERSTIRIRTKAGIESYRAKGGKMGPKPKPERNARIRKKIKGGMSWAEVAADEGVSRQTIYRVMHKETAIEHRKRELEKKQEVL